MVSRPGAASRTGAVLRLAIPLVMAGCSASPSHSTQSAARVLAEIEMDWITVGNARATSRAFAQSIGPAATAATLSSDLSLAGSSSIMGAPFLNYAMSQSQALSASGESAGADGSGEIFVGNGTILNARASTTSVARATGQDASAAIKIQLYGITVINQTSVAFGTIDATACCGSDASAEVTVNTSVNGPYVTGQQAHRIEHNSRTSEFSIAFAEVSSLLPLVDPSLLAAALATRIAPRY